MDIHQVIEQLGHSADARAQLFGPGDSSALLRLKRAIGWEWFSSDQTRNIRHFPPPLLKSN